MKKRLLAWLMVVIMGLGQAIPANVYAQEVTAPAASEQSVSAESVTEETSEEKTEAVSTTTESTKEDVTEESKKEETVTEKTESKDTEKKEVAPSETEKEEEVTEEATISNKETEQTEKEDASKGISTLSESEYVITLNSPQMIQADGSMYYFRFVAPEAGKYTFYYTSGKFNYGYISIIDIDTGEYIPSETDSSWPSSATVNLTDQQQVRIEGYVYSEASALTYMNVRKYDKDDHVITVEDIQLPDNVEIGQTFDVRVKFNSTDISKFYISSWDGLRFYWPSEANPTPEEDGYYTLHNVSVGNSGTASSVSVDIYHNYGYEYSDTKVVSLTAGSLQSRLDALSADGGGVLEFTEQLSIDEAVVIPENVTLLLNFDGDNYFNNSLEVLGRLKSRGPLHIESNWSIGSSGNVFVVQGLVLNPNLYSNWGLSELNAKNGEQIKIRGAYGAYCCIGDDYYQYRNGEWRTPTDSLFDYNVKISALKPDEITEITSNSYQSDFSTGDFYNRSQWLKFTAPSDGAIDLRFGNIINNGEKSIKIYNSNSEDISWGWWNENNYIHISDRALEAGETYYIQASFRSSDALTAEDVNLTGDFSFEFKEVGITAAKLRDALDFENATYSLVDSEYGNGKECQIIVPIKEDGRDLFSGIRYGTLVYDGYYMNMDYNESGMLDSLVFRSAYSGIAFEEGLANAILSNPNMSLYGDEHSYYISSAQESWFIDDLFNVYRTDFGKISQITFPLQYMESIELSLEGMEALSNQKQVYSFTAIEDGTYTFYVTDGQGDVYFGKSSVEGLSTYIDSNGAYSTEMEEGQTIYVVAQCWEEGFIGVTADTGEVKLSNIQLEGSTVIAEQGPKGTLYFDKDIRRAEITWIEEGSDNRIIQINEEENGHASSTINLKSVFVDEYWNPVTFTSDNNYHIEKIKVRNAYGMEYVLDENSMDNYSILRGATIHTISLQDYIEHDTNNTFTFENLSISGDFTIPAGKTVIVTNELTVRGANLTVNGILNALEMKLYDESNILLGNDGEIKVERLGINNCSTYQNMLQCIKGTNRENEAYVSIDDICLYMVYYWTGSKWHSTEEGMPDLSEMIVLNQDNNYTWEGDGEIWFLVNVAESGNYKAITDSNQDFLAYIVNENDPDNSMEELGFGDEFFLVAGEQIVLRESDNWLGINSIRLVKNNNRQDPNTLFSGLDISNAKLSSDIDNTRGVITQSIEIPVEEGSIIEEYYSNHKRKDYDEEDYLSYYTEQSFGEYNYEFTLEYDDSKHALVGKRVFSLYVEEATNVEYIPDLLVLNINGNRYVLKFKERENTSHSSSIAGTAYYTNGSNLQFILKKQGAKEIHFDEKVAAPNDSSEMTYYTFTPQEDARYAVDAVALPDSEDTDIDYSFYKKYYNDEFGEWDFDYVGNEVMEAGQKYYLQISSFGMDTFKIVKNETEISNVRLANVKLIGNYVTGEIHADVTGGKVQLKDVRRSIKYGDDYEDDWFEGEGSWAQVEEKEEGVWTFFANLHTDKTQILKYAIFADQYNTWYTIEIENPQKFENVGTFQEALNEAETGTILRINYLYVDEDDLTIPKGITVKAGYVRVGNSYEDGSLSNNTLTVNGTLDAYELNVEGGFLVNNGDVTVDNFYCYETLTGIVKVRKFALVGFHLINDPWQEQIIGASTEPGSATCVQVLDQIEEGIAGEAHFIWNGSSWIPEEEYDPENPTGKEPTEVPYRLVVEDKIYDGTNTANVTVEITDNDVKDAMEADGVSIEATNGRFSQSDVGNNLVVDADVTLIDANPKHYVLASAPVEVGKASIKAAKVPYTLTATNKVYDGTSNADVTASITDDDVKALMNADQVSIKVSNAAFAQADVGTDIAAAANVTLTGDKAGNYELVAPSTNPTADITAVKVAYTLAADDKVYNGSTDANVTANITDPSMKAMLEADGVSIKVNNATFAQAAVGREIEVSADITLSGNKADNYKLVNPSVNATADITAAKVAYTLAAADKVYDGTNDAKVTASISDDDVKALMNADQVSIKVSNAAFAQADVGSGIAVTAVVALTGDKVDNYELLALSTELTANIIAADMADDVAIKAESGLEGKSYSVTVEKLPEGAKITYATAEGEDYVPEAPSFTEVGEHKVFYKVTKANYKEVTGSVTVVITKKPIIECTLTADNKVYDGTTDANVNVSVNDPSVKAAMEADGVSIEVSNAKFA
ncbi:MAG: YDG domain-containing protein [Eubacteriales bacterium]|nr:YDG domain-containing protein [Eubacteriales bacterium]